MNPNGKNILLDFGKWKAYIRQNYAFSDHLEVHLRRRLGNRYEFVETGPDGEMTGYSFGEGEIPKHEDGTPLGPSLVLAEGMCQALLDAFWEFGIRPTDRRYDEESKLLHAHLEDMRQIAFKLLKEGTNGPREDG